MLLLPMMPCCAWPWPRQLLQIHPQLLLLLRQHGPASRRLLPRRVPTPPSPISAPLTACASAASMERGIEGQRGRSLVRSQQAMSDSNAQHDIQPPQQRNPIVASPTHQAPHTLLPPLQQWEGRQAARKSGVSGATTKSDVDGPCPRRFAARPCATAARGQAAPHKRNSQRSAKGY